MDKAVLIGGGGHASVVLAVVRSMKQFDVIGYTDLVDRGLIFDVPYLGADEVLRDLYQRKGVTYALMGLGQVTLDQKRRGVLERVESIGYISPPVVAHSAVIQEGVEIGNGTVVFEGVVVNTSSVIGRGVILNTRCLVDHDCVIGDFTHIAPGATISGGVRIGADSIVGAGATIIHGRRVASRSYIGAGAVVVRDIVEPGVYAGVPARKLRDDKPQ